MRFTAAIAFVAAMGLVAVIAAPGTALAHARYMSSTPAKGEVVATSPAAVEITFTQDIQKVSGTYSIEVERDRGASVTAGPAVVDDSDRSKMSVPLNPNLIAGRYVVHWTNASDADGDPAEGAFSFYVQTKPTAIDLENDQQLELVGAEEETPAAGETSQPATAAASPAAGSPTRAAATATATSGSSGGDSSNNTALFIVIGVAVVVVLVGGGAALRYRNRRA